MMLWFLRGLFKVLMWVSVAVFLVMLGLVIAGGLYWPYLFIPAIIAVIMRLLIALCDDIAEKYV